MTIAVRQTAANVKNHLQDNARFYGTAAVGTAVAATAAYFGARNAATAAPEIALKVVQLGHHNTAIILNHIERSTPSVPVMLERTGQVFNSLSEAARETGISASRISAHINHGAALANGEAFKALTLVPAV